jgi:hypothetical protein
MEQSSMSQGYSEIPLKKPEDSSDEDKKTKKTTKPRFGEYLLHDKKPARPSKLESLWLPKKESADEKEEKQVEQPEKALPDGDTTWEDIQERQRVEPQATVVAEDLPPQLEAVPPAVAETDLSLDEGDVHDLPLEAVEATEIHRRVHFEVPEASVKDEAPYREQPPTPLRVAAAELPLSPRAEAPSVPETVVAGGAGNGGNNGELPPPLHNPEQPLGGPEPINPATVETLEPAAARWEPESHEARLAGAVPVSELAPSTAEKPTNTEVIEYRRTGEPLAALVGVIDWFRGRKIRKEHRRSQKRQEAQIKTLQEQTTQQAAQYEQRLRSQQTTQERLQRQFNTLRQQTTHNEQHTRELQVEQIRQAHEATKRAAMAEKAIEQVVELPPEHHLEKSVWHNIEVDKTGRAVERPVLQYGHEFQREQYRETRTDDIRQTAAATGQLAVDTASHSASPQPALSSLGVRIPKSMRESTKSQQPGPQLSQKLQRPWVLVVLIIAFFVVVSLLIMH